MVPWRPRDAGDPDECGGFRLTHRIGSGGFGTVFLGFRADIKLPAAVKIFTSPKVTAPAWRERFRREIKLIEQMAGVHTAELLDSGGEDDPRGWPLATSMRRPSIGWFASTGCSKNFQAGGSQRA
ncbi:hypothetical protein GCM10029963_73430 [Micromonospora andamanensis]